jgi:vacuolar iron transporter family protein
VGGIADPVLARFEGRHRSTVGNALRAVLGASDGLTTNLSLVMGVAGANLPGHTILFRMLRQSLVS